MGILDSFQERLLASLDVARCHLNRRRWIYLDGRVVDGVDERIIGWFLVGTEDIQVADIRRAGRYLCISSIPSRILDPTVGSDWICSGFRMN